MKNESTLAAAKPRSRNGAMFTSGLGEKKQRSRNTTPATPRSRPSPRRAVVEPLLPRAFFQHVLQAAQEHGEADGVQPVDLQQQPRLGLLELAERDQRDGDGTPGMMLTKNSQRQPSVSVIRPPIAGPSVGARVEITPRIAVASARALAHRRT